MLIRSPAISCPDYNQLREALMGRAPHMLEHLSEQIDSIKTLSHVGVEQVVIRSTN